MFVAQTLQSRTSVNFEREFFFSVDFTVRRIEEQVKKHVNTSVFRHSSVICCLLVRLFGRQFRYVMGAFL